MYKTIRHGENSLQYTILPQNDDIRMDGKLTSVSCNDTPLSSSSSSSTTAAAVAAAAATNCKKATTKNTKFQANNKRKHTNKTTNNYNQQNNKKRSIFAYLGLLFVCTVIIGAILIPFLVSAECLPNPSVWFIKTKVAFGGGGHTLNSINNHNNGGGNGGNKQQHLLYIKNYHDKNNNSNLNHNTILNNNSTNNNKSYHHLVNSMNIEKIPPSPTIIISTSTSTIATTTTTTKTATTTTAFEAAAASAGFIAVTVTGPNTKVNATPSSIRTETNEIHHIPPASPHIIQNKHLIPITTTTTTSTTTTTLHDDNNNLETDDDDDDTDDTDDDNIENSSTNNDLLIDNNEKHNNDDLNSDDSASNSHESSSLIMNNRLINQKIIKPLQFKDDFVYTTEVPIEILLTTTKKYASIKRLLVPPVKQAQHEDLLNKPPQTYDSSTKKPPKAILPVLAKTNSILKENGQYIVSTTSQNGSEIGTGTGANTNHHIKSSKNWINSHWPLLDPSPYFQWMGYKSEDSVLLPAILGIGLIGVILIVTFCLVARNKRIIVASVRKRKRNDIEDAGEDNTTLLTTDNLSDPDEEE